MFRPPRDGEYIPNALNRSVQEAQAYSHRQGSDTEQAVQEKAAVEHPIGNLAMWWEDTDSPTFWDRLRSDFWEQHRSEDDSDDVAV